MVSARSGISSLVRLSVSSGTRRADLGVPSGLPVAELVPDLARELCAPEYTTNAKEQVALEKKDDIKKRLGFSPDDADALAISFAMPIMRRPREKGENKSGVVTEWDEYA